MFRRGQIKKKAFTHGMIYHVVSKGLANPNLLSRRRLRVASHRVDEGRTGPLSTGRYSPLRGVKIDDPKKCVKHKLGINLAKFA
jgi:hypothetical protein